MLPAILFLVCMSDIHSHTGAGALPSDVLPARMELPVYQPGRRACAGMPA